MMIIWRE